MKRTTLFVALASAFSLSAFGHGQSGAQSSQSDQSSSYQQSANDQTQSPGVVKQVQQKLSEKGQDVGQPDGNMGPKTQAALKDFQQQNGLQPTGQIDQQTLAALDIDQSGSSATGGTASPSQGSSASGSTENDTGASSNNTDSNASSSGSYK